MKNLTISLPDDVAADLRVRAAKAGKSMSRYVADKLAEPDKAADQKTKAIERFLARPRLDLTDADGNAPTKDEIYGRKGLY
jgi:plasmid stability protein